MILYVLNSLSRFSSSRLATMPKNSQYDPYKETRRQVRTWLLGQHYTLEDLNDPEKAWVVIAKEAEQEGVPPESRFGFGLSQHRGEADVIGLAITMMGSPFPGAPNPFAGLPANERETLLFDLRMKLAQFDVAFRLENDLSETLIGTHIYRDGLTQDRFFQAIHTIRRAFLTVHWTLERKFSGRTPPSSFNVTGGISH